jgi:hypothetical protein
MIGELIPEGERKKLLVEIKEKIENEGFKTSWRNPFFDWVQGIPAGLIPQKDGTGDILYVIDPPVPRLTPFDLAAVSISITHTLYFTLTLYYCKVLDDAVEADRINEINDWHASQWSVKTAVYFNDIACKYGLEWDTEYDEYIDDTLFGNFPVDSPDQIISIMRDIKEAYAEWKKSGRYSIHLLKSTTTGVAEKF